MPATPDEGDDGAKAETPEAESPTEQPAQGSEATADQLVEIGPPDVVGSVQVVEEHVPVARARTQRRVADSLEAAELAPWGKHDEQQPPPHTQQQQRPAKKRKRRRRKPSTSADVALDGTASTVITDDGGSVGTSGGRHKLTSIKPKVPSHTVKRRRGAARRFASNDDFKQLKAQCKITSAFVGCCSGLVPISHLCVLLVGAADTYMARIEVLKNTAALYDERIVRLRTTIESVRQKTSGSDAPTEYVHKRSL